VTTPVNSTWFFFTNAAPLVPTGVVLDDPDNPLVDQWPLITVDAETNVARPTVSAEVRDPDGGQVQALFTITQDGIVIMDSVAGSWATVTPTGTGVSSVRLPYELSAGSDYKVSVVAFDGSMASSAFQPIPKFTFKDEREFREIPSDDDHKTGATS
jgi:hypothetical protein